MTSTSADRYASPIARASPPHLRELIRTARPRQWLKNLRVFAAPGTAGLVADTRAAAGIHGG